MTEDLENVQTEQPKIEPNPIEHEVPVEEKPEEKTETPTENNQEDGITDERIIKAIDMIKTVFENKDKILKDINEKREYLINNLADYDTENYLQNDAFQSLYSQAFNALGTKLNTPKFIELVENYVNSRIESNNRKLSAQKENESVTDSLAFKNGVSKKTEKPLKFQDIPPEELEHYISLYI